VFTLEESEKAVGLGREVTVQCLRAVEARNVETEASSVADELPQVVTMLNEIVAAEGLELR
jgi:hypothetical protein